MAPMHSFSVAYAIVPGLLPKNGLMGNVDLGFQGADRSQVARAESPASDRVAFA